MQGGRLIMKLNLNRNASDISTPDEESENKPARDQTEIGKIVEIPRHLIQRNIDNHFQSDIHQFAERIKELRRSITEHGINQPLEVRVLSQDEREEHNFKYRIIAGDSRFFASGLASINNEDGEKEEHEVLEKVPCIVKHTEDAIKQTMLKQHIENLQRRNEFNPLEVSNLYMGIAIEQGFTKGGGDGQTHKEINKRELAKFLGEDIKKTNQHLQLQELDDRIRASCLMSRCYQSKEENGTLIEKEGPQYAWTFLMKIRQIQQADGVDKAIVEFNKYHKDPDDHRIISHEFNETESSDEKEKDPEQEYYVKTRENGQIAYKVVFKTKAEGSPPNGLKEANKKAIRIQIPFKIESREEYKEICRMISKSLLTKEELTF